ncbi:unnamed protein product [Ilex paraguariensis]|uniref:Uncharacterized protein n=1 Tax=Ilex paraguariensis TaxID=185542 RepID=A0ABC8V5K8_9AQUA
MATNGIKMQEIFDFFLNKYKVRSARLQSMKEIKLRYVDSSLSRTMADLASCAAYINTSSSEEFIEMMLVDSVFIIEFFIRNSFPS